MKEGDEIETNVKNKFEQLSWLKNYQDFIFEISTTFLLFLETKGHFEMYALSPQAIEFFKKFFHICFYLVTVLQNYLFVTPLVKI